MNSEHGFGAAAKRGAALVLAFAALSALFGCAAPSNQSFASPTTIEPQMPPAEASQQVSLPLYFSSRDGQRLRLEMRQVSIDPGESRAVVAIRELLKGPSNAEYNRVFWPGTEFVRLEQARGVASVYLNETFEQMFTRDRTLAKAALIKTLNAIDSTQYLNVYAAAREPGYDGKPSGVTEYFTQELSLYLEQVAQRMETRQSEYFPGREYSIQRSDTYKATLYFTDATGRYLLPEVREITVLDTAFTKAVIEELIKGPLPGSNLKEALSGFRLTQPPEVTVLNNGRNKVSLALEGVSSRSAMAIASIVYSVGGFLQQVEYFDVTLNGRPLGSLPGIGEIPDNRLTRAMFSDFAGAEVPIYASNEEGGLTRLMRTMPQAEANNPSFRLQELLYWQIPLESDGLSPVLSGADANDIPRVTISGDTAWIDCSASFVETCSSLNEAEAFLLMYAMVNTVCEFPDVRLVQFLVNGEGADHIAGSVYTRAPLMKNPGIVGE